MVSKATPSTTFLGMYSGELSARASLQVHNVDTRYHALFFPDMNGQPAALHPTKNTGVTMQPREKFPNADGPLSPRQSLRVLRGTHALPSLVMKAGPLIQAVVVIVLNPQVPGANARTTMHAMHVATAHT